MAIELPITVPMTIAESGQTVSMQIAEDEALAMSLGISINTVAGEHYEEAIDFIPTQETQTIHTAGLIVDSDITIEPIPNNYGLITWDGSALTVS